VTDVRQPAPRPGLHHLERAVAVANTTVAVQLTTAGTATRLSVDQARAIGWALIEAAGFVESTG
jgi:hypothetical protein